MNTTSFPHTRASWTKFRINWLTFWAAVFLLWFLRCVGGAENLGAAVPESVFKMVSKLADDVEGIQ